MYQYSKCGKNKGISAAWKLNVLLGYDMILYFRFFLVPVSPELKVTYGAEAGGQHPLDLASRMGSNMTEDSDVFQANNPYEAVMIKWPRGEQLRCIVPPSM